jgi:glycerate-2-kinase
MPGISLDEKQRVTELLLRAGASINEMNTVRKHISRVKGGWLAQTAYPATILSLILSDVIGNPLDVIASGPTAPDPTTYGDVEVVLEKYQLRQHLPASVREWIELGVKGQEAETPKSSEACFQRTTNVIIGGIDIALAAARGRAEELGLSPEVVTAELQGEARSAGGLLAHRGLEARNSLRSGEVRCLLSGGETTVTVRGDGVGGRNQELALAFALGTEGVPGITLLSAGTDGIDGPTDAAGAIVDGETATKARASGLDPAAYLERNDSYSFFKQLDSSAGTSSQIKTGQTGTNVMDLQILCVEKKDGPE